MPDKNYLPFEQEGQVYTDDRSDAPSKTLSSRERALDPSNPPVDQGFDADAASQQGKKPRFRQFETVRTDERENPGQAVRDAYTDA